MSTKEFFSLAAIALTFWMFVPYIRSIRRGATRPHVFSWVTWGLGTVIVFFAQLVGGAGLGAWPIGLSGALTSYIAVLAYRQRADVGITRGDWLFFFAALSALPAWFLTSDPLWAVVILTGVDLLGFGPTVRRAWHQPLAECASFFGLGALRNTLAVAALEQYTTTTVLFPAAVGLACLLLVALLVYRRRVVSTTPARRGCPP